MKAEEYHEFVRKLGEQILPKMGFQFYRKNWHYLEGQRQVSLISANTKFGIGFQIKHLTITLIDLDIPLLDGKRPKQFQDYNWACPVQISPMVIESWVQGGFDDESWHFVYPDLDNKMQPFCYHPVYYGGPGKWILLDRSVPKKQNREALLDELRSERVNYLEEERAAEEVKNCLENYGRHTVAFLRRMTPKEIVRHVKQYGMNRWAGKKWISAYKKKI